MVKACSLFALGLFAAGCRPSTAPAPASISTGSRAELRAFIDSMADAPEFSNAHWGILIVDPERGDTLYSRNAGKLFMPASNMKILTSATALTQLGPDYRYRTTFAARGTIANGTLDGDLLVIGRGDPSVSDHMFHDAMIPLRLIADSHRGARHQAHHRSRASPTAMPSPATSSATAGPTTTSRTRTRRRSTSCCSTKASTSCTFAAARKPGDPATLDASPARFTVRGSVMTVDRRPGDSTRTTAVRSRKDSTNWEEIISGQIGVGDTTTLEVTHHDPDLAYVHAMTEALIARGIEVGDDAEMTSAGRIDTLATLSSPPLSEILKALMKPSQNQIAEMLFRTIALEKFGSGRPDSAAVVVRAQIAQWGVPANGGGHSRRQRPLALRLHLAAHASFASSTRCASRRTSRCTTTRCRSAASTARSAIA